MFWDINFLADSRLYETEKPYAISLPIVCEPLEDARLTNLCLDERLLTVIDMRRSISDFDLNTAGFMLVQQPTCFSKIEDMHIFEAYKLETEQILERLFRPELVVCWIARVRKWKIVMRAYS